MGFWTGLVNDSEKKVNPAHVVAFSLVFASIFWVSYLVYKNKAMPDLSGVAMLLGGSGAMNIAHKAEEIIDKFKKKPEAEETTVEPAAEQPTLILKKKE
jgi:hypothetical protein